MGDYTLIITEKPDAAKRIAEALATGQKAKRMTDTGVPYYVVQREQTLVIVPALGHLYTVDQEGKGRSQYPVFEYKWVPRYIAERKAKRTRTWLKAISKLAENAKDFIDACDYDIEGSIIGYTILKNACNSKDTTAKRMKYSTLTREELETSYNHLLPHLDFALIEAGLTRHEIDWLYGINLSRALTTAAKTATGRYRTLSTGRVQGPTLKCLVTREKAIKNHVPVPYWEIRAEIEIDGKTFEAMYEKRVIETKKQADAILDDCRGRTARIDKVEGKQFQQPPPFPFDLGTLQSEAYRFFGYNPARTLSIAQHLYLAALISYPRTNSQKLPPTIGYSGILKNLAQNPKYAKLVKELLKKRQVKPNEGKKDDPAHPAIYPTGNKHQGNLTSQEESVLDMIIRRFMATFGESATKELLRATISMASHHFYLRGSTILKKGWLRLYHPYIRSPEVILPPMSEGQDIKTCRVLLEDKLTEPPSRYNPSSILKQMEKMEIGTKATRADVIQTLYNRKCICDERIAVTDLGFQIMEILEKYSPLVVSARFTRELEQKMDSIQRNLEKRENVLRDTIETLRPVMQDLKKNEKAVGEKLREAVNASELEERTIGSCPTCRTGKLVIIRSRKTGKRFVGCTNYFRGLCKTAFPLPQKGTVKPLRRRCQSCGWPTIQVRLQRRRFWTLCFNPRCPLKERRKRV